MAPAETEFQTVEQKTFVVPDITIKELLGAIPPYCFNRSALRSSWYIVQDALIIAAVYKSACYVDSLLWPEAVAAMNPYFLPFLRFITWCTYGFWAGLFATGLWVVAHECGHQAFSESKFINNAVGWVLHSGLGVPYHSWRISHAKHHASTGHMTQDQVFVPSTRSEMKLFAFDPTQEDKAGSRISNEFIAQFLEALGESPIGAAFNAGSYLLGGWWLYISINASGQKRYPKGTSHFNPNSVIFTAPHHYNQVVISDIGIAIWGLCVAASIYKWGFFEVFRLYLVPYLWVNHWLVLITFLQHTDPLLPHYRAPEFTFPRGALATFDRDLMGGAGRLFGKIGAFATHGISETHVAHHVASKIPHYYAWEANDAIRKVIARHGLYLKGRPGGWSEMYRVYKECKFVEDDGDVVFYKNEKGFAQVRAVFADGHVSDSGVEIDCGSCEKAGKAE
ncbi:hypothetical protein FISHEDRAFT_47177 [Fistulina hepatica ATCC 64428]|uniref:Fatty acid desaturase domain-containing protein n=1 Tax=Fistulina hepatica ATCC 64428 TaxID=1128425 RepID=A0A0D7A687_9AGAR|nr:hypothetical protein FISHEDRAFT_47177 [Fistulina hepatica ATCC 64428]